MALNKILNQKHILRLTTVGKSNESLSLA